MCIQQCPCITGVVSCVMTWSRCCTCCSARIDSTVRHGDLHVRWYRRLSTLSRSCVFTVLGCVHLWRNRCQRKLNTHASRLIALHCKRCFPHWRQPCGATVWGLFCFQYSSNFITGLLAWSPTMTLQISYYLVTHILNADLSTFFQYAVVAE